ncbi:helix-turn-helix transcriptional regulator [Streptomyces sp. B21-108]|uniref:helix-turn-helix transcriptional regulator n=1 Tax=Streptomyces sp. B21-108 TaxID=3039419 RepID=UPI002FEFDCF2
MSDDEKRWQVAELVGVRLRALREAKGLRQEDVVTGAKSVGLQWGRSSVAALEAGTRSLSIGEFLLIPALVAQLGGWNEPLFSPTDRIIVSGSLSMTADKLPNAMIGYLTPLKDTQTHLRGSRDRVEDEELGAIVREEGEGKANQMSEENKHRVNKSVARNNVYWRVLFTLDPNVDLEKWKEVITLDYEITRTVASRLTSPKEPNGVNQLLARVFAFAMYGQSLGAERDQRADLRGPYASRRALQSARGHATREIIEELQESIDTRWPEVEPVFRELESVIEDPASLRKWLGYKERKGVNG